MGSYEESMKPFHRNNVIGVLKSTPLTAVGDRSTFVDADPDLIPAGDATAMHGMDAPKEGPAVIAAGHGRAGIVK
jgi:hypothetical protein